MEQLCQISTENRLLYIYQLPEMSPCVTQPANGSEYLQNIHTLPNTYGSEVWSTGKDVLNKLEIFQKRVLKWISSTPTYD